MSSSRRRATSFQLPFKVSVPFCPLTAEIGCTGEVRINREGSYAEWGIEILVSYRDNEQMEVLTASRQSGGVSCQVSQLTRRNGL